MIASAIEPENRSDSKLRRSALHQTFETLGLTSINKPIVQFTRSFQVSTTYSSDNKLDCIDDQLRLVILNGVPAPCCHYVQAIV